MRSFSFSKKKKKKKKCFQSLASTFWGLLRTLPHPVPSPPPEPRPWRLPPVAPSLGDELVSSSSIFDHVDRLSRGSADGTRRPAGKVQLIAMQPRPGPSLAQKVDSEVSPVVAGRGEKRQGARSQPDG